MANTLLATDALDAVRIGDDAVDRLYLGETLVYDANSSGWTLWSSGEWTETRTKPFELLGVFQADTYRPGAISADGNRVIFRNNRSIFSASAVAIAAGGLQPGLYSPVQVASLDDSQVGDVVTYYYTAEEIAVSEDGDTVAFRRNAAVRNSAYTYHDDDILVYRRISNAWTHIGTIALTGYGAITGFGLSMSHDGNTLAVRSSDEVIILEYANSSWSAVFTQAVAERSSLSGSHHFNLAAMSGDGNVAAYCDDVGGVRKIVFVRKQQDGTWSTSSGDEIAAEFSFRWADYRQKTARWGGGLSLSADGSSILSTAPSSDSKGTNYLFQVWDYYGIGDGWVPRADFDPEVNLADQLSSASASSLSGNGEVVVMAAKRLQIRAWDGASWNEYAAPVSAFTVSGTMNSRCASVSSDGRHVFFGPGNSYDLFQVSWN